MTQVNKRRSITPKQAADCCAPIDDLLDPDFFKGLTDPTRLKLLGCLAKCGRPCSVSEIAGCCDVDFSVVSRHLAVLERSKIIKAKKQGRTVFYEVMYVELARRFGALADAVANFATMECCLKSKGKCCG